ncbi:HNH endonuclease signature motif containing protein, partial [Nocardiopsis salina]|uniref:HNH endonuclease signature motif containing protein n=1 Tax=Nocardiopsis salina TaxID=245836 RepID=UPI00036404A1
PTTGGETTGGGGEADTNSDGDTVGGGTGGGCGQPPGTKAVINTTGATDKANGLVEATGTDNTEAGTAGGATDGGTSGAAGTVAAPGPEPGSGTEPSTGPPTTTNTTTGTGDTGTGDPPRSAGLDPSTDIAVTEDGHVLALSAVRAMAPTAQIRRLIFDDRTGLPLDLGRAHRLAPGYLRTAAFIGHTTCAWSGGCDVPVSQCEADHITEFSRGGETTAANLQPLCSLHNRLKYRRTKKHHTPTEDSDTGTS